MDEAMHPLTLLAVGLYGKTLMNQNGAPIRLEVPWKYRLQGGEVDRSHSLRREDAAHVVGRGESGLWYGFYSNVNPNVSPVRWDQSRERRLPGLFATRRTEMFNGYANEVQALYAGMDLKRNY